MKIYSTMPRLEAYLARGDHPCARKTVRRVVSESSQLWRLAAKKSRSSRPAGPSSIPPTTSGR
jgi:hypothetical protein